MNIVYRPTEKIVTDFSSKPLQGKIFVVHRNAMLGTCVDEFDTYKQWHKEALQRYELWDELEYNLEEL